jgi:quinol monooxygenase YgiN
MIVRIVKMTFQPEQLADFIALFEERKETIRGFEGCKHLELWEDAHDPNIYFTYSKWESGKHLDHYRFSDFFKDTWARTKALFADKPQAWSVTQKIIVEKRDS